VTGVGNVEYLYRKRFGLKNSQTQSSETLAFKLQTPVNHPEESIGHSEHGESLKSRDLLRVTRRGLDNEILLFYQVSLTFMANY
jgi:hypothetical protein